MDTINTINVGGIDYNIGGADTVEELVLNSSQGDITELLLNDNHIDAYDQIITIKKYGHNFMMKMYLHFEPDYVTNFTLSVKLSAEGCEKLNNFIGAISFETFGGGKGMYKSIGTVYLSKHHSSDTLSMEVELAKIEEYSGVEDIFESIFNFIA